MARMGQQFILTHNHQKSFKMNNPQNHLAHITIHEFKAKHKITSLYMITHIIRQLDGAPEANCTWITTVLPTRPHVSFLVGQSVAQKGEATCPRPRGRPDLNLGIRIQISSCGGPSTARKDDISGMCVWGEWQSGQGISSPGHWLAGLLFCYEFVMLLTFAW